MRRMDWNVPAPRPGLAGAWDRFIGPGATASEEIVQLAGGAAIGLVACGLYVMERGVPAEWGVALVLVLIALDLGGGIGTNATGAAKRWYHRPGQGWPQHMGFIAVHLVHVALVSWLWAADGAAFFLGTGGMLLVASGVVLGVPLHVQRPVAFCVYALVLLAAQLPWLAAPGLDWFIPLLFLKLILAHLVVEAPFAPDAAKPSTGKTIE